MLLKGKNIVITGSGRGIGKSIALACASEGANVGLMSRTDDELNQTSAEINDMGMNIKIAIKSADVTNFKEVSNAFEHFNNELGQFNGVIANAGASRMGKTHEFDNDRFVNIINVNIIGVFYTFKAAYPYFKLDDKNDKARFIITGSAAYTNPMPQFAAYTATKYAMIGFQESLALEYKRENINFNQILPTMVDTRLLRGRKAGDGNKPDNVMSPRELNDYYLFLLSENSNRLNDEIIFTNYIQEAIRLMKETSPEKGSNWDDFKGHLETSSPKIYQNVRKLGKLIDFLIERGNI
jgi:3-oxoacyl-[acyl-carrier protein] reductase